MNPKRIKQEVLAAMDEYRSIPTHYTTLHHLIADAVVRGVEAAREEEDSDGDGSAEPGDGNAEPAATHDVSHTCTPTIVPIPATAQSLHRVTCDCGQFTSGLYFSRNEALSAGIKHSILERKIAHLQTTLASAHETIDILSDPDMMRHLREAESDACYANWDVAYDCAYATVEQWIDPHGDVVTPLNMNRLLSAIFHAAVPVLLGCEDKTLLTVYPYSLEDASRILATDSCPHPVTCDCGQPA